MKPISALDPLVKNDLQFELLRIPGADGKDHHLSLLMTSMKHLSREAAWAYCGTDA